MRTKADAEKEAYYREKIAQATDEPFRWPGDGNLLINGKTGSGKSLLLREIMRGIDKPILLIDPKQTKAMAGIATYTMRQENPNFPGRAWWVEWKSETGKWPTVRYVPDMKVPKGRDRNLDYVLGEALRLGHIVVVSDETVSWADQSNFPPNLAALEQLGREPDVQHIRINQRTKKLPDMFINQSTYFVSFWVNRKDDRERLAEIGVDWEVLQYLPLYHYASYNQNDPEAREVTIHRPLRLGSQKKPKEAE